MKQAAYLIALSALVLPGQLAAQAYQCRAPGVSSVPQVSSDSRPRNMPVTGYTMALSWSPEFCKPRADSRSHKVQCSGDNGRFGLVVHGLWPQGANGRWPQWCKAPGTVSALTPQEVRRNMCMMPSARLVARQWAKHGSCMVKRPATYFKVTRILWDSYRIPDYDRISREDGLTAGRIRKAFADANPGISASAVGVKLNQRGWLQELRVCYGKRFRPTRCDANRFGARDGVKAKIWRGL
ncbi:ribonuclease T2 family protein [Erythrobacter crassostreae]|uniref:Ribonuclease T n=1 Tax=Erythrobacter crassostreae TaxID=2828328 RepID=A0A9X1F1K8_9SPHN|nr:ribonuclease T [Erythrobacter crassostrea]MBV7258642.1 ribonuclease T [Erythrobacter crassostrea]